MPAAAAHALDMLAGFELRDRVNDRARRKPKVGGGAILAAAVFVGAGHRAAAEPLRVPLGGLGEPGVSGDAAAPVGGGNGHVADRWARAWQLGHSQITSSSWPRP